MEIKKYLFIDRDGTLIVEPDDKQVDSYEKFSLLPQVIPSLLILHKTGYRLVAERVSPHLADDHCDCRKPKTGLVEDYMGCNDLDRAHSYVMGDRLTDLELARAMGI